MKIVRLTLLAVIAVGLTPGTWLRSAPQTRDYSDRITFRPLDIQPQAVGALRLEGGWELVSRHPQFGSYSALVSLGDDTLLAGSDRGRLMRFAPPGASVPAVRFLGRRGEETEPKEYRDLESLTRDPRSGTIWAGYEASNSVARLGRNFTESARIRPTAMQEWSSNSGAETLLRLDDGRFLIIAEGRLGEGDGTLPALLFPGDPLLGSEPARMTFVPPEGFRPVDAAQLPDGRVLVLVRKVVWGLPPRFENALVLLERIGERAEGELRGKIVARIAHPLPTDNFEGLAAVHQPDGGTDLWLISDDNDSMFQRTLLLKLSLPADF